jgi:UDP-N-acetylmuramate dehydrogenase
MQWERERLRFSYRSLAIDRGNVILYVRLRTDPEDPETVGARIGRYLKHRKERQPLDYPSAGSVFKNPPGDHAGRLLEHAGLKGVRVGGAMISPKHANFIVNTGGATAADILELVRLAQTRVREKSGIQLEPEIHVVGR